MMLLLGYRTAIVKCYADDDILGPVWMEGNQWFTKFHVGFALKAV
jgi:hypothetical protein